MKENNFEKEEEEIGNFLPEASLVKQEPAVSDNLVLSDEDFSSIREGFQAELDGEQIQSKLDNIFRKKKGYYFSAEQEDDLAIWFRENELFYNRGIKDFKEVDKKYYMYEEKAASLNPPCSAQQLKTWFDSMRTRYGKLTTLKSNKKKYKTDRDKWILNNFAFLDQYIIRSRRRKHLPNKKRFTATDNDSPTMDGELEQDYNSVQPSDPISTEPFQSNSKIQRPLDEEIDPQTSALTMLLSRVEQLQRRMDELSHPKNNLEESVHHLLAYQATQLVKLHPSLWDQYSAASMNLLLQFMTESRKIRRRETEQPSQGNSSTNSRLQVQPSAAAGAIFAASDPKIVLPTEEDPLRPVHSMKKINRR